MLVVDEKTVCLPTSTGKHLTREFIQETGKNIFDKRFITQLEYLEA